VTSKFPLHIKSKLHFITHFPFLSGFGEGGLNGRMLFVFIESILPEQYQIEKQNNNCRYKFFLKHQV